jgi:hypothetical protein
VHEHFLEMAAAHAAEGARSFASGKDSL